LLAARALFAFEIGEGVDVDGERWPSDMALLGGLMKSEERAVVMQFAENFTKFVEMWMKVQKVRSRGSRKR